LRQENKWRERQTDRETERQTENLIGERDKKEPEKRGRDKENKKNRETKNSLFEGAKGLERVVVGIH
jgi:hypothetical protein